MWHLVCWRNWITVPLILNLGNICGIYVKSQGNTFYGSVLAGCIFSLKMENTCHCQNMNHVSTLIILNIFSTLPQMTETECMHTDTCVSEICINDNGTCRIAENTFSAQLIFDHKTYKYIFSIQQRPFFAAFEKVRKATISFITSVYLSVCLSMSVRPSASNNSPPTGQVFIKFGFWVFFENLWRKFTLL
jgi:hypothetical protein